MAADAQSNPFMKHLASSDKRTRDQALISLRNFLGAQSELSELDLLKLWKGLFYCLWMQDKPHLQNTLSLSLAALPTVLQSSLIPAFFRAFWVTISREWTNIEALRMDKYLFLIRQYVLATFQWLARNDWSDDVVGSGMQIVREVPLDTKDMSVPNGLRYHVMDVWVDELEKVEGEVDGGWKGEWGREVLKKVLEPVRRMEKEGRLKTLRMAARECLEDERLREWVAEEQKQDQIGEEEQADEEEEWGGIGE